jgi:hypothetical protein
MLMLNLIPTENKNTIHLPNCSLHDVEILTMTGGESISQQHTTLAVAKFTGKWEKIQSGYFIATPHMFAASVVQLAKRTHCVILACVAFPALLYFSTLYHNSTVFIKKLSTIKFVC